MNSRYCLKMDLMHDSSRRVVINSKVYFCEGMAYKPHQCYGGIEMNEVIFTRNHIRHLTPKEKNYFWTEVNCALVCSFFHKRYGHSRAFREWWIERAISLYGIDEVSGFIDNAPLKIKGYNYIIS